MKILASILEGFIHLSDILMPGTGYIDEANGDEGERGSELEPKTTGETSLELLGIDVRE